MHPKANSGRKYKADSQHSLSAALVWFSVKQGTYNEEVQALKHNMKRNVGKVAD